MDHTSFDWTYHGLPETDAARPRIVVERTTLGLSEREDVQVLRQLHSDPAFGGFHWGYHGGGPSRAAAAVLADAVMLGDGDTWERYDLDRDVLRIRTQLRVDFMWDVTCLLTPEWRMRRSAVLRWVRGWYADKGLADPPAEAVGLPPADPYEVEREGTARVGARWAGGAGRDQARCASRITASATPAAAARAVVTSSPSRRVTGANYPNISVTRSSATSSLASSSRVTRSPRDRPRRASRASHQARQLPP